MPPGDVFREFEAQGKEPIGDTREFAVACRSSAGSLRKRRIHDPGRKFSVDGRMCRIWARGRRLSVEDRLVLQALDQEPKGTPAARTYPAQSSRFPDQEEE